MDIAAGGNHACALLESGAVRCWGRNDSGQLGYGNTENVGDDETPASAGDVNVGGTVRQVAAGFWHTCALLDGGAVRCWGYADQGQLGYASTVKVGDDESPASAGDVVLGGVASSVSAGGVSCAVLDDGAVRCWGWGGSVGYGRDETIGDDETPQSAGNVPFR